MLIWPENPLSFTDLLLLIYVYSNWHEFSNEKFKYENNFKQITFNYKIKFFFF